MALTPYLRRHLSRTFPHVDSETLDVAIEEFLRFARLAIGNERFFFPCSKFIDDIWHALILETRDYAEFCENLASGKFLHHNGILHDDYTIGRNQQAQDDEDLSVLVSYIANFGPFSAQGARYWVTADSLMKKQRWSVEVLNQVLLELHASTKKSEAAATPASDPRSLLRDFHATHLGASDDFFSTAKTSEAGRNTYDVVASRVAHLKGSNLRILDVGCGSGGMFRSLAKQVPTATYVGIDISLDEIYLARRRVYSHKSTFVCGDAEDLPFKDCYFDVVISHMTMHILENPILVLQEIRRVLRPDGTLIFVVPTRRCDSEAETAYSELLALFGDFPSASAPLGATRFRTTADSMALLRSHFSTEEPSVIEYQIRLDADDASVLNYFRTMYPYAKLEQSERPVYEAKLLEILGKFRLSHPESTLDRRTSLYTIRKDRRD